MCAKQMSVNLFVAIAQQEFIYTVQAGIYCGSRLTVDIADSLPVPGLQTHLLVVYHQPSQQTAR